jgi:hypothetical protein
VLAWDQVRVTARITMPDEIDLIAIGPAIHAGFPCDQGERIITLPQPAPEGLKLGEIAASARLLRLFNVHPDQDEVYATTSRSGAFWIARRLASSTSISWTLPARARPTATCSVDGAR